MARKPTRAAILKPDHLGDLVLAQPAIRAIARTYPDPCLYVAGGVRALAQHLFPELQIETVNFPHLSRSRDAAYDITDLTHQLANYGAIFSLRDDPILDELLALQTAERVTVQADYWVHETLNHQRGIETHVPAYTRTELFSAKPPEWPRQLTHVGLCVAAGFPTNRWPILHWVELALALADRGIRFTLIGGPAESDMLQQMSHLLRAHPHETIIGTSNYQTFSGQLAPLDLVIATDGGGAHLCSLTKPILSIFGSSPWRRFAPFGLANRLVSLELACSPCVQISPELLNTCVSRECLAMLGPQHVLAALDYNRFGWERQGGALLCGGASHLNPPQPPAPKHRTKLAKRLRRSVRRALGLPTDPKKKRRKRAPELTALG